MKNQVTFKRVLSLLLILFPFFSSAYNNGDLGSWNASGSGAVSWASGSWAIYSGGSWVSTGVVPAVTDTVYILSGYTMTVPAGGIFCYNLTVENGAKLYSNDATLGNQYDLSIYGAFVLCNGIIGNPGTQDDIVFDIEGANCIISGSGTFEAARIRKSSKTAPAANTTNLFLSMNINLRYNSAIKDADMYNNVSGTAAFNVTFSAGYIDSLWSYGALPAGDICIDGTQGTGSGERTGIFTVNGTLVIAGTLFLTTNNATLGDGCSWVINNGGVIKTVSVNANASGAALHTLTMNSGSKLQIGCLSPATTTFSLSNNIYNLNSASTIEYFGAGAQNIDNNLTYANLTLSGTNAKTASGTLNITGDLTINSPDTLIPNAAINISGNWNDYGTKGFLENGLSGVVVSTVTFNGSGNQTITITPAITGENFVNVTVNKISGYVILDGVTKSAMVIADTLNFISGIIEADSSNAGLNLVSFTNGAIALGANNSGFVNGRVKRLGNSAFTFPVGKGSEYRPVSISNLSGTFTMFGQYFNISPDLAVVPATYNTTLVTAPIDSVSRCEYWTLQTTSSVSATVTLSWDTYSCGVTDPTALLVARDISNLTSWTSFGNGGTTGTAAQGTIASSSTISFTSAQTYAYTLADTSLANALPVSLLSFSAKAGQNNVLLAWATVSEINNNYFTIEKTIDGDEFVSVGEVKGSGSSTFENNYTFTDNTPSQGISYYRLKQTDYDGHFTNSALVPVNYNAEQSAVLTLFPNPVSDRVYININTQLAGAKLKGKTYTLDIFDINGREAMTQLVLSFSSGSIQSIDVAALPAGVYLLELTGDSEVQRTSLVKQ